METNKWWQDIDKIAEQERYKAYDQIVLEWGKSSKRLKDWLLLYYPLIINNNEYSKKADINAHIFLPPRKGTLWAGEEAITRLKLAVKAEVIILFSNTELEYERQYAIYKIECLKLWTFINSLVTKFSFEEFCSLLDDTYNYVMNNWDETVQYLQEKTEVYKPKRDQALYHYKIEDFMSIRYEKDIKTAYEKWIVEVWPTLLDKYKEEKLNEYLEPYKMRYLEKNKQMPYEEVKALTERYNKKLDKIKINKIKYRRFASIIKKLNSKLL